MREKTEEKTLSTYWIIFESWWWKGTANRIMLTIHYWPASITRQQHYSLDNCATGSVHGENNAEEPKPWTTRNLPVTTSTRSNSLTTGASRSGLSSAGAPLAGGQPSWKSVVVWSTEWRISLPTRSNTWPILPNHGFTAVRHSSTFQTPYTYIWCRWRWPVSPAWVVFGDPLPYSPSTQNPFWNRFFTDIPRLSSWLIPIFPVFSQISITVPIFRECHD